MNFHEVRFPAGISLGAVGGPERKTEIVTLGSGFEQRNARWADSRRRYDAGYGVKTIDELHQVIEFFEERRGRLFGFRWKDWLDYKSCPPLATPTALDQEIGFGDGVKTIFQLTKRYGSAFAPYLRTIVKPSLGSVRIAIDGEILPEGEDWSADHTTGRITFRPDRAPAVGKRITTGFEFDTPVRFDDDQLSISLDSLCSGSIPKIPIVELRL
jgi:uncharacterized protein (TIGR02217 family)